MILWLLIHCTTKRRINHSVVKQPLTRYHHSQFTLHCFSFPMFPVIALVGRPNVGKSTLFNRLTRSRDALVDDQPGITRDRLYGVGRMDDKGFVAVDTGGLGAGDGEFSTIIREQVELAIEEAQAILFMVDAHDGLTPQDRNIGERLRHSGTRVLIAVNKSENVESELAVAEFHELGLGVPIAISAKSGYGVDDLLEAVLSDYAPSDAQQTTDTPTIALAGRPNVGKSTLANRLAGASRVLVSAVPGTTRDSVRVPLCINGQQVTLIDTAGVRRKSRVAETIEKFSAIKALQAMGEANVVLLILDATSEIGTQDATIAGLIAELGRSMVVVVNKWEGLASRQRQKIKDELELKLPFLPNPEMVFISALRGTNVAQIIPAALRAYDSAMVSIATSNINRVLARAVTQTPPPMRNQRVVRLKFAHQAGKNPPVIVVHGNLVEKLPSSYVRYLANYFVRAYRLAGTPLRIITRSSNNPYLNKRSIGRKSATVQQKNIPKSRKR